MHSLSYQSAEAFDELFTSDGQPRPAVPASVRRLASLSEGSLRERQQAAEATLHNMGSPSMSTATRRAQRRSGHSTWSRGLSTPTSGPRLRAVCGSACEL